MLSVIPKALIFGLPATTNTVHNVTNVKLKNAVMSILSEIESPEISLYGNEQKEDLLYDAKQVQDMVLQWKAHVLRAENQDQAKQNSLKSLQSDSIPVLMDWAMKFNQLRYRKKQAEWYGK